MTINKASTKVAMLAGGLVITTMAMTGCCTSGRFAQGPTMVEPAAHPTLPPAVSYSKCKGKAACKGKAQCASKKAA